jgi:UDP-glucuronate 4-epimerase
MRIMVTGGLGFIGSRLCDALLDEGCGVRCVDNLSSTYAKGTGPSAAGRLAAHGAEVILDDARPAHLRGMDAAIHLAAIPGVRTRRTAAVLRHVNVDLTGRLARAAARQSSRLVFVSSSSVYGDARTLPTPEHAPLSPLNPYAECKAVAEAAVLAHGGDAVIARPFTVYGPGQRPDMAFARWISASRSGSPLPWHAPPDAARDFTYVDDAVAGLIAALRQGRSDEAYNLSGWRSVSLRDALGLLDPGEIRELPCSPTEALVTSGCGRKAAAELGYEPRVELAAGLARQLEAASSLSLAA